MSDIAPDISIEKLIQLNPEAIGILIRNGLPCVVCGEPFWGTLEELVRQKGWDDSRIQDLVRQLTREK